MSDRLWVATRKGLFLAEKRAGGRNWDLTKKHFVGVPVSAVLDDRRDGTVYAALDHGHFGVKMHRSKDQGATFEEIGVPAYPDKPEGFVEVDPNTQKPREWKLKVVWCLEAGHREDPGVVWCGTLPGGLFRSGDQGATWELNRPLWDHPSRKDWMGGGAELPAIHSICVHPKKKRWMMVGVSCAGAWVTEDGGKSWEPRSDGMFAAYMPPERARDPLVQDPHRIVLCRSQPDCLWTQHHNGVFRTVDAGKTWTEVQAQPSVFGFAVAVHPKDPETAWFVPGVKDECRVPVDGKVVVSRTRDGGKVFDVLNKGLPEKDAYDLVLRHAMDIDDSGKRLAFGSTTGNLWVTTNQGDAWTCISNHLPPIYAVRFGS